MLFFTKVALGVASKRRRMAEKLTEVFLLSYNTYKNRKKEKTKTKTKDSSNLGKIYIFYVHWNFLMDKLNY